MKRPRIPESHTFPFGYDVTIVRHPIEAEWGLWDDEKRIIMLDQTQTPAQMRYTFLHEMEHAFKDWQKWVRATFPVVNPDGATEEPNGETPTE